MHGLFTSVRVGRAQVVRDVPPPAGERISHGAVQATAGWCTCFWICVSMDTHGHPFRAASENVMGSAEKPSPEFAMEIA